MYNNEADFCRFVSCVINSSEFSEHKQEEHTKIGLNNSEDILSLSEIEKKKPTADDRRFCN